MRGILYISDWEHEDPSKYYCFYSDYGGHPAVAADMQNGESFRSFCFWLGQEGEDL